eukprot:COSAG06_NODE_24345_length_665_cov_1.379859_1_plen_119_part_10
MRHTGLPKGPQTTVWRSEIKTTSKGSTFGTLFRTRYLQVSVILRMTHGIYCASSLSFFDRTCIARSLHRGHAQCAQVWARKSGPDLTRAQPMMTLLRAGRAGAAAGAPRFASLVAPPDR